MTRQVTITQENIDQGLIKNPDSCPIGLAVNHLGFESKAINEGVSRFPDGSWYQNSCGADQFIHDFDNGLPVSPTTLTFYKVSFEKACEIMSRQFAR